jgi:microcystin-dependent protein
VPVETFNYIDSLNPSFPPTSDGLVGGDDHIRGIKSAIKATFPGLVGAATRLIGTAWGYLSGDGSAAAPAYSYTSDPTLGIYRSGPGVMTVKGTLRNLDEVGEVRMFAGSAVPSGWASCDGTEVPRVGIFSDLYAKIGTTWGAGNGSTTFNLPNLQDRFPRHRGGSFAGAVGTMQSPQNLSHTHGVVGATSNETANHSHPFSGVTGSVNRNAAHAHTGVAVSNTFYSSPGGATGVAQTIAYGQSSTENTDHEHSFSGNTGIENVPHGHNVNLTTGTGSADGSEARPYSATLLFCIRY